MKKKICKHFKNCPMKRFCEEGRLDKKWIEDYCFNDGKNCKRFELEEADIFHPDNMLPNGEINESLT